MASHRGRLRWHCRRALLELDIVLARFLEQHFEALGDAELETLEELLLLDDYDLWALVNGSKPCGNPRWEALIGLMRPPLATQGRL